MRKTARLPTTGRSESPGHNPKPLPNYWRWNEVEESLFPFIVAISTPMKQCVLDNSPETAWDLKVLEIFDISQTYPRVTWININSVLKCHSPCPRPSYAAPPPSYVACRASVSTLWEHKFSSPARVKRIVLDAGVHRDEKFAPQSDFFFIVAQNKHIKNLISRA